MSDTPEIQSVAASLPDLGLPRGSRYLVTGGGTGGHVYPAIAIADEIRRLDDSAEILYVGVRGKAEAHIVPKRGYPIRFVTAEGWPGGRHPVALLRFVVKQTLGVLKSLFILMRFRPRLIIGTGGYVAAPIMLAAILLRRLRVLSARTFVHEQNTFPGKLNRLIGGLVDCVGVSFPESLRYFPRTGTWVGYPVRREVGADHGRDRAAIRARLGIPEGKRVVFAFGGSQGARTINHAIVDALPLLKARGDVFVIHGTGTFRGKDYDAQADTAERLAALGTDGPRPGDYLRRDYFHNIEEIYAIADLVVCRAGAGTLTEIAARGLPAIILPKVNLPGDHQVRNARTLAASGAGVVLYERVRITDRGIEEHVPGELLAETILALLDDPERLDAMGQAARQYHRADALERITSVLASLTVPPGKVVALPGPQGARAANGPDLEAMSAPALIGFLTRRRREGAPPLPETDLEYLKYRADDYLTSPRWQVRNHGVKLVGLLQYRERLPHLLYLLKERRPVGWLHRLMGGDYRQVGFIRRNVFDALIHLDVPGAETVEAIELGLEDGYYEVRSHAARAAEHFAGRLGQGAQAIEHRLEALLRDRWFEVVCAALEALGRVSDRPEIVTAFRRFQFSKYWRVRLSVVRALGRLLDRGVARPEDVADLLDTLLITSDGFQPHFPLKAELRRVSEMLSSPRDPARTSGRQEDAS